MPRSITGTINSSGEFRIFGIPPGRYLLAAPLFAATPSELTRGLALYPNNGQPREFVIAGGDQYEGLEFLIPGSGASFLSGKVTGPCATEPYTIALVESEHPSIRLITALTAADSTFHYDSILPGTYDLYAEGPVTPPSSRIGRPAIFYVDKTPENLKLLLRARTQGQLVDVAPNGSTQVRVVPKDLK